MSLPKTNIYLLFIIFVTIFFQVQGDPSVSQRDLSSLINLLGKKTGNNRPVVVILDPSSNNLNKNKYVADTSDELESVNAAHLLLQKPQTKMPLSFKRKTTKSLLQKEALNKNRYKYVADTSNELESVNAAHLLLQKPQTKIPLSFKRKTTKSLLQKEALNKNRYKYVADTSDELESVNAAHLLLQKPQTPLSFKRKTTKSLLQLKQRNRLYNVQRLRVDEDMQRDEKDALRSPIIKKLLRISNRLQCDAKDDCNDRCNDKFKGKRVIKCKIQCEVKYDCNEEERDPCVDDCADSCGNDVECLMSTRGERLATEADKCKRC